MPIGVDLPKARPSRRNGPLRILWNHRWEFDKGPEGFFRALYALVAAEMPFELVVLGERYKSYPQIFDLARAELHPHVVQWGYVADRQVYERHLADADVVVSTADHEFFGISIVEACHAGCVPLVPNGLSYPEIFADLPEELRRQIFYNTHDDLVTRLRSYCMYPESARALKGSFRRDRFGWESLRASFDKGFEAAAKP
jgi:glycosyltransferase involved in cell wall biosynthesis